MDITDLNGTGTHANRAHLDSYGYGKEEFAGRNVSILNPGRQSYTDSGISGAKYDALFADLWNKFQDAGAGH